MKKIIILLTVMIILSFFSGISINRNWFFIFQFELIDFPEMILAGHVRIVKIMLWCLVIISHMGILLLPFVSSTKYFKLALLILPLVYLLSYLFLRAEFLVLLIPFTIIWLITLRVSNRYLKSINRTST